MSASVLYLIRHGPPQYPVDTAGKRRIYGSTAALTDDGRRKCHALGRAIYRREGAPLTVLVTSPYLRAVQTAEILANEFGSTHVITDARLKDTYSSWEGVDVEEFVGIFEKGRTFDDPRTHETIEMLGQRMYTAYSDIVAQFPEQLIGIISHGDPLRALYYTLIHPRSPFPAYPDLVQLVSLDTAQGLRLQRTSSGYSRTTCSYISAEETAINT